MQASSPVIKAVTIWLTALMLSIAAAVVVIWLVNAKVYGPAKQVENYFQALQDGDGALALGILNAEVPEANAALLDADALRASTEGLEVLGMEEVSTSMDGRTNVVVNYRLDGAEQQSTFELEQTGTRWMFFDEWSFRPQDLPTVRVNAPNQNEAQLNGARVLLPEGSNTFAAFYPSRVAASYTSGYFEAPEQSAVLVGPGDSVDLTLRSQATEELVKTVDARVREFLDNCAGEQNRLAPPGCPFYHLTDNRVEPPITWEILEYPTVEISPADGHWVLAPLQGKARVSATQTDLFSGAQSPLIEEKDFTFGARLSVTDAGVSLTAVID
ncbi:hypothetical protein N9A08_14140 [Arthrobacter koreensis]|uniref:DUF4878 domain-containing protein n=1 Tax=Arthrobacter koreensis TaxID=199136 RepID=A0ABY6FRZ0_9MICC|nr:hypothetical protein [Arthrobacter koreensis]UYB35739.1 hypothetical protein N9A08_14140 [Arthrobacter koreensis]